MVPLPLPSPPPSPLVLPLPSFQECRSKAQSPFSQAIYIYILITNEDRKQFPFNPPIFRSHSVIFFRVTNQPLTYRTFKLTFIYFLNLNRINFGQRSTLRGAVTIMINSSKISSHRFIATTLFCVVKEWPHSSGNIHGDVLILPDGCGHQIKGLDSREITSLPESQKSDKHGMPFRLSLKMKQ